MLALSSAPAAADDLYIASLAFHPTSNALVLARGSNGELRLVDFADPAKPVERRVAAKVGAAAFLPDGRHIVTAAEDGSVRVRTFDGTEAGASVRASGEKITSIAVSASGRFLAAVDRKLRLRVWQASGTTYRLRFEAALAPKSNPSEGSDVAFAPDDSAVAAISLYGNVFVRKLDGRPIAVPRGQADYESCCGVRIAFSGDGRYLIARRGYQPGNDAFVWTFRSRRFAGGDKFPDALTVREFAVVAYAAGAPTADVVILDKLGLRTVSLGDGIAGTFNAGEDRMVLPADAAKSVHLFAISTGADRIATVEEPDYGAVVYRDGTEPRTKEPLGRLVLR